MQVSHNKGIRVFFSNGFIAQKISSGKNKGLYLLKDANGNKLDYFESIEACVKSQTVLSTDVETAIKVAAPVKRAEKVAKKPAFDPSILAELQAKYDAMDNNNGGGRINVTKFGGNSDRVKYQRIQGKRVRIGKGEKPVNRGLLGAIE